MNIGEAAKAAGVSAKMIRYYETIALIPSAARAESGYRVYAPSDVHTLRFIKRARGLGFSLEQVAELLALWRDKARTSAGVKQLARGHVETLKGRIAELQGMVQALEYLVEHCHGDDRPDCPILDNLSDRHQPSEPATRHGNGRASRATQAASARR
jgi:MerR family copper efflux transcriptional regulator